MPRKDAAKAKAAHTATGAEMASADAVRAARQARRDAKAAEDLAKKALVGTSTMGRQADRRKNAFGIASSASKATAVSHSIISRARGGRNR